MSAKKILVIGSSNMDLSLNMYEVPKAGETLIDDGGVAYTPGGKSANAAVAFAKLARISSADPSSASSAFTNWSM